MDLQLNNPSVSVIEASPFFNCGLDTGTSWPSKSDHKQILGSCEPIGSGITGASVSHRNAGKTTLTNNLASTDLLATCPLLLLAKNFL